MLWIWLVLLVVFVIVELATVQLVTIWFALGSLAALIATFFTDSILIQSVIMVAVSLAALLCTRPFVKKLTKSQKQPTNADMYIGTEGMVTEEIDNLSNSGQLRVKGAVWSARSTDDAVIIPVGQKVIIEKIEGVKLIVTPSESK